MPTQRIRRVIIVSMVVVASMAVGMVPTGAAINSASIVPTPNVGTDQTAELRGVSCVSVSFCVAVGSYHDGATTRTLAMAWDGSTWTIQPTPNAGGNQSNVLDGVSCVSVSFCIAVGDYLNGSVLQTLAMVWDGSTWTIQPTPNAGTNQLNVQLGVSCASVSSCVAVGYFHNGSVLQTLVLMWDGSTWTVQSSPNMGTNKRNLLRGVSCVSVSSCVAAGYFDNGTTSRTLVVVWDGSTWTDQPSPNVTSNQYNELSGVSCVSVSSCVAIGWYYNGSVFQTLALAWDGSTWAVQPSPNVTTNFDNYPEGVSCASVSSCVAIGTYDTATARRTMVLVWDGSTWTVQSSPNNGPDVFNELEGSSCVSASWCIASGWYYSGPAYQTLAMVLTGPETPPTTTTTTTASTTISSTSESNGAVAPAFAG